MSNYSPPTKRCPDRYQAAAVLPANSLFCKIFFFFNYVILHILLSLGQLSLFCSLPTPCAQLPSRTSRTVQEAESVEWA